MTTATNWREIDTSTAKGRNALNREIARRLGWQHKVQQYPLMSTDIRENTWITYPEYPPTGNTLDYFPRDWANSVDAALMLITNNPKSERLNIQMFHDTNGWLGHTWAWRAEIPAGGGSVNIYLAIEATPALAICKAWLEMTDGAQS